MNFPTSMPVTVTNVTRDSVFSLVLRKILQLSTKDIPLSISNDNGFFLIKIGEASYYLHDLDEMSLIDAHSALHAQLEVEKYKAEQKLQSSSFMLPGPNGELKIGR